MKADQAELKANMKIQIDTLISRMDAYQARMDSHHEMTSIMKASLGMMESSQERIEAKIKPLVEEMNTDFEANQEEIVATEQHQVIPNVGATVENVGKWEVRSGDRGPKPTKRQTKDSIVQGAPKGRTFGKRCCVWLKCSYTV
jgi:hypothetical protein